MDPLKLNELQMDAIREVGNIGAGHASTALGQMIGEKVSITVPEATMIEVEKIPEVVGGPETLIVGIYLRLLGDANGNALLTFEKDQALYLADMMLRKKESKPQIMNEEKEAALKELGNILMGAYLTALSTFLGFNIIPSIPYLAYDMAGAVVDLVTIELGRHVDSAMFIKTDFSLTDRVLGGNFLIFFEPESSNKILSALGVND